MRGKLHAPRQSTCHRRSPPYKPVATSNYGATWLPRRKDKQHRQLGRCVCVGCGAWIQNRTELDDTFFCGGITPPPPPICLLQGQRYNSQPDPIERFDLARTCLAQREDKKHRQLGLQAYTCTCSLVYTEQNWTMFLCPYVESNITPS